MYSTLSNSILNFVIVKFGCMKKSVFIKLHITDLCIYVLGNETGCVNILLANIYRRSQHKQDVT